MIRINYVGRIAFKDLLGAASTYFLLIIIWALAYTVLEINHVSSFQTFVTTMNGSLGKLNQQELFSVLLYYSFITISTVGYGDIVPVHKVARMLSSMEAILGQFYITILIARLVGLHIYHINSRSNKG